MIRKTILITGCSSGFGYLLVERFAQKDWNVIATTRSPEKINLSGSNITILAANVVLPQGRAQVAEYIQTHCNGKLDCLINNIGYGLAGPLEMLTEGQIREEMEVNFFTPLFLTQALLPFLRVTNGRVINFSSILGFAGMPMYSIYAASKFALEGLTESLHFELAPHKVQVALIEPSSFATHFREHMVWPPASSPFFNVYESNLKNFQNYFSRSKNKNDRQRVQTVINTVEQLVDSKNMPLRVRVGRDSQQLYYLRRLLPRRLTDWIFGFVCKKIIGQ